MTMNYWNPEYASQVSEKRQLLPRLLALFIIILILFPIFIYYVIQVFPFAEDTSDGTPVRVAVIDSGVNSFYGAKIVASRSFILPEYGYPVADMTTGDSTPDGVPHGTIVAETIQYTSDHAQIVNAKVLSVEGSATTAAMIAAIDWAIEQNCSVINMSLGGSPTIGDPLERALKRAFSSGVIVVVSAGNEGSGGVAGSSISSPAVFEHCIAVGALDELRVPAEYSSWGPASGRYMKPDVCAAGYYYTGSGTYYGTSFAAPRVAGMAAEIIAYCIDNGIPWTPGLVKAVLMRSAIPMSYPEYVVGAGRADLDSALGLLSSAWNGSALSVIAYVGPSVLPLDFERVFDGDNYTFRVYLVSSHASDVLIDAVSTAPDVLSVPPSIYINQSGYIDVQLYIPLSGLDQYSANLTFSILDRVIGTVRIEFEAPTPSARIAFEIAHSSWAIDTVYGQFKELYRLLTRNSISVTEIRDRSKITAEYLSLFDAVFILDPCVWNVNETDPYHPKTCSFGYTPEEIDAYRLYFKSGGGIFVTALSNNSLDVASLNEFLSWTNFSLGMSRISSSNPDNPTVLVTDLSAHPILAGISSFDYYGAPVNVPTGAVTLARYNLKAVLGCLEGSGGGRIVVTGTNFFIDNWGILGEYRSSYNDNLSLKIAMWLIHSI